MTIVIIYVYSVFSSLYFDHNFEDDKCDSLIQCYFTILSSGFINGSGVGGILSPELYTKGNSSKYFGYVFVSITFFIAVNFIMLNLVFRIIVDTFGELREQSEKYGK